LLQSPDAIADRTVGAFGEVYASLEIRKNSKHADLYTFGEVLLLIFPGK